MSGRAGRRGKDDKGIVIQMLDEKMEPEVAKGMIYGDPDALYSSYHVGYNMVLNMLRVEDANPENVLKASFHQYQQEQQAPALEIKATELQREANSLVLIPSTKLNDAAITSCISEYYNWHKLQLSINNEISNLMHEKCQPFLNNGRLVYIQVGDAVWGWGCVVQTVKWTDITKNSTEIIGNCLGFDGASGPLDGDIVVDVLLEVLSTDSNSSNAKGNNINYNSYVPAFSASNSKSKPELLLYHVSIKCFKQFSSVKLKILKDVRSDSGKETLLKSLQQTKKLLNNAADSSIRNPLNTITNDVIPVLDPIVDLNLDKEKVQTLVSRYRELGIRMKNYAPLHTMIQEYNDSIASNVSANESNKVVPELLTVEKVLERYKVKLELIESAKLIRQTATESQTLTMKSDLKQRMRVLRRVGYISETGVLETKGRFACELNTGDELVLTDMVFEGIFKDLTAEQCVALLSCFVHKEGSKDDKKGDGVSGIRTDLQAAYRQLQVIARNIARISIDAKMEMDEEEYVSSFNHGMIEVCYSWATGAKFVDICKLTDIFEGSIIRTIRRLEELLRQLASACMALGNQELKVKFEDGANKIRRGVVFAASLYL